MTTVGARQWRLALEAEFEVRQQVWSDIQGHLEHLHQQTATRPGCRVLELGTRSGMSTAAFLAGVDRADGHLWSVDLEQPQVPSWWQLTGRWTLTLGDDLDPQVQAAQPDRVEVLFLDTSHTYDHTLAELHTYVPRVVAGGVVLLHDTELHHHDHAGFGVVGEGGPVARALDTFCEQTGRSWSNRPGSFGLGVIEVNNHGE